MIKAIIFDCFGVLTADQWRAFVDSLPSDSQIKQARELNKQYDAGLLSRAVFLDHVYKLTGHHPKQIQAMLDNEIAKNTRLLDYINVLRGQGYKIGMISNVGSDWITRSFLTTEEQELFDTMVFSYQVGITKPDPKIYELTCERLNVQPQESVFVDDIDRYCEAAHRQGMASIEYTDFPTFKSALEAILYHA